VGCFLNVHEAPPRIGSKKAAFVALDAGMVVSNEPGLYRQGEYGIRVENLVAVHEAEPTAFGRFYRLETLTLCHIDTRLVDVELLTEVERAWLNSYNDRVYRSVAEELEQPVREWLSQRTAAV
jgi:Xaa-Pro aminopeptidase